MLVITKVEVACIIIVIAGFFWQRNTTNLNGRPTPKTIHKTVKKLFMQLIKLYSRVKIS